MSQKKVMEPIRGLASAAGSRGLIAQQILDAIIARQTTLREGELLFSQSQLCHQLHASPGLLREALSILEDRGVISIVPGRGGGIKLKRPTMDAMAKDLSLLMRWNGSTLAEIVDARIMVEQACARQLCQNPNPPKLDLLMEACSGHFHHALVAAADNAVLLQMFEALRRAFKDMVGGERAMNGTEHHDCLRAHRLIAAAIGHQHAELAEWRLSRHLHAYLEYVQKPDPRPGPLREGQENI